MKSVVVTGPDTVQMHDVETPHAGPADVVVAMRAVGICGSDVHYAHVGGYPPRMNATRLGHEGAGEVIEVGDQVTDVQIGDHVVINPMAAADGIIGNGGAQGELSEVILLTDAQAGKHFRVVPKDLPWDVAALNEPMAVAYHGVNRSGAGAGAKAVVFGAGPVGLGAAIGLKSKGAAHVVVVDIAPNRLQKALAVGADAVIDSSKEDVVARLRELHGEEPGFIGAPPRPLTDVAIDAAGVPVVTHTALNAIRARGVLTVIAVHKQPVSIDFQELLVNEPDIRLSMGYPTEIFEVTDALIEHRDRYAQIISDRIPFEDALRALDLASTPGATDKVVVTFP